MVNKHLQQSFLKEMIADVAELVDQSPLTVFIMGPALTDDSDAGKLRNSLIEKCKQDGDLAVLPEHEDMGKLLRKGSKQILTLSNLERLMARRSGSVVLIPSSPGSFAELGMFSQLKTVCSKMLILLDKKFNRVRSSYIYKGPAKTARDQAATISFVDYSDQTAAWKKVSAFINRQRRNRFEETHGNSA